MLMLENSGGEGGFEPKPQLKFFRGRWFAKLGIDLRQTKQEMRRGAIDEFVAKHKAMRALR